MKRIVMLAALVAVTLGVSLAAYRPFSPDATTSLSRYAPSGALLYLEARDFSAILNAWNNSQEKRKWVASSNYEVFSRSRLFSRLGEAGDQFAAAAGLPPDMNFVWQAAGKQSAVALYDIGNLEFLYITKLASADATQSALWQSRAKFETRESAGISFFFRRDAQSEREVAFAVKDEFLVLATREHLMAGALQLLAGMKNQTVEAEPWFAQAASATGPAGDLRLVLNLEKMVASPHFRSYWVQRNVADLRQYTAAASDLFLAGKEYREERLLVKKAATQISDGGPAAVADLARLVPEDAGVFQLRAAPSEDRVLALLETKLLAPHIGPGVASEIAPQVALTSGETGNSTDLETRIDVAPVVHVSSDSAQPLKTLLHSNPALATLQLQSTETDKDGVFVRIRSAVALLGTSDWNEGAVRSALVDFVRPTLTASQLGVAWQPGSGFAQLDGLLPLVVAVQGKYLIVSDDPALVTSVRSRLKQQSTVKAASLIAGFNHARERERFARLTGQLDAATAGGPVFANNGAIPAFLSGNIASFSSVLAAVSSERVVVRDAGDKVLQTVAFEWSR
jgi:hypothetical protein